MSERIEDINEKLIEKYGKNIDSDLPRFRVVWSTDQIEKRYGEFEVFSEAGIFLRSEKGIEEVKKYGELCHDKWVLEQLFPTVGNPYLEKVTKYSYEPVWVFGAANSNPTPIWRAVDYLVRIVLHGDPNAVVKSPADLAREEAEAIEREKIRALDILNNDVPDLAFSLKHGTAVTVPTSYGDNDGSPKS